MEGTLIDFLRAFGLTGIFGVALTIIVTQLIKIPVKAWAVRVADDKGVVTQVYTWVVKVIAVSIAMIVAFLGVWIASGFDITVFSANTFNWTAVIAEGMAIWGLANSAYTTFEDIVSAKASEKTAALSDTDTDKIQKQKEHAKAVKAAKQAEVERKKTEAENVKALREAEKAEKKQKALEEKLAKARADKEAEIKKLEEQLNTARTELDTTSTPDDKTAPWAH